MDNNKKIVKALLEKNFVDAKESVFNSLYAKASLLLDEERVGIAAALFAEDKAMGMYSHDQDEEAKKTKKKTKSEKPSMYEDTEEIADEAEEIVEDVYDRPEDSAAMRANIKKAPTPKAKAQLTKLHKAIKKSPMVYGVSRGGEEEEDYTGSASAPKRTKKLTRMAARSVDGYDAKNTDRKVKLGVIGKINKGIKH
jgi:hypothetical protein